MHAWVGDKTCRPYSLGCIYYMYFNQNTPGVKCSGHARTKKGLDEKDVKLNWVAKALAIYDVDEIKIFDNDDKAAKRS